MARTTIDVDREALETAREALGTEGLSATVNEALRRAARDHALAGFDVRTELDGTPAEVEAGRDERPDERD